MTDNNFSLTTLYHPTGAKVSIPLNPEFPLTVEHAMNLITSVDTLLNAGFTVNLPGLLDGENFEQIGFAVRREKVNDDSTVTPIVDVYPVNGSFRVLGLYLNTQDDVKNFEAATGLHIEAMPLYDGSPIERGSNPRTDRYITPLKSPAKLVWKLNPKWEGENDKKHPKRVFSRWDGLRPMNGNGNETAKTDYSQVKTPGGALMSTLDEAKLHQIAHTTATNVTQEMRDAAAFYLQLKAKGK